MCTKEFFEHHANTNRPINITQMQDGDNLLTTQSELEKHILTFYEQLYSRDEQVEANVEARDDCFQFIKVTVTEEHNTELLRPLTMEEVTDAMNQLPGGKTPVWIQFRQNPIRRCGKTSIWTFLILFRKRSVNPSLRPSSTSVRLRSFLNQKIDLGSRISDLFLYSILFTKL